MVPSKAIDNTSYEIWNDNISILLYLKDLRCDAYVKYIVSKKLGIKSYKNKFVWYLQNFIGYYLYYPIEKKYLSQNMLLYYNKLWVNKKLI